MAAQVRTKAEPQPRMAPVVKPEDKGKQADAQKQCADPVPDERLYGLRRLADSDKSDKYR